MMDMEMRKNASGYYDETAYKAMTTEPKAGEIWTHNVSGAYMLVVANIGGVCIALRINENPRDEHSLPVTVRTKMWTNPQFLGNCRCTALSNYAKAADKEEFEAIKSRIAEFLDLAVEEADEEETEVGMESNEDVQTELMVMRSEVESAQRKALIAQEKVEFYRKMYNELLDKVIGRVS